MVLSLDQSLMVLKKAFAGQSCDSLEQALDVACDRYGVDSPTLASKVFEIRSGVPLFSHILIRAGSLPLDGNFLDVSQGIKLFEALMKQGADIGKQVTIADRSYTPLELLVASLPGKVRGEDFLPLAKFLIEQAGAPLGPLFERRFGKNQLLEDFLRGMGQEGMASYLAKARISRPTPRQMR